jgi:TPR repeat protein
MPKTTSHLRNTSAADDKKCKQILEERNEFVSNKTFSKLSDEQQLQFCRLNKELMESYWDGFQNSRDDENYETAARFFFKAFEMGFLKAIVLYNEEASPDKLLEEHLTLSPNQDKNFYIGICYHLGLGLPQNRKEAWKCFSVAAKQGLAIAQHMLGRAYDAGKGVGKDQEEAMGWYKKAAEQGLAIAQNRMGHAYDSGDGDDDEDEKEAMRWYRMAAEQGLAIGQYNLGLFYDSGVGVDKDEKEAVHWYRKAAEQGLVDAQCNLGYAYHTGSGVDKDEKEAVCWFKRAAEQGCARSLTNLKKIQIPLALYAVALLEKNEAEVIKLALDHEDIQKEFLENDIVEHIVNRMENDKAMNSFFTTLLTAQAQKTKLNSFLIDVLRALSVCGRCVFEHNKKTKTLRTRLIQTINLADIDSGQIKPLLQFFCDLSYEDETIDVLKPLITLLHRVKTLDSPMDDTGLNKLVATKLIHHCYQGSYGVKANAQISLKDLMVFASACDTSTDNSADKLKESLLINSRETPKNLLPKLKVIISNSACWGGEIPCYIAQIIRCFSDAESKNGTLDEESGNELLIRLKKDAKSVLRLSEVPGLLTIKLKNEEKILANLLKMADTKALLVWVDQRVPHEQHHAMQHGGTYHFFH